MTELPGLEAHPTTPREAVEDEAVRVILATRDSYQADLDKALRALRAGGSLAEMELWTRIARGFVEVISGLDKATYRARGLDDETGGDDD